jgi:hypothetical protein
VFVLVYFFGGSSISIMFPSLHASTRYLFSFTTGPFH